MSMFIPPNTHFATVFAKSRVVGQFPACRITLLSLYHSHTGQRPAEMLVDVRRYPLLRTTKYSTVL